MHHVKNDKRSLTSAKYIYKALATLLKNRPYETISVSQLCEEAKVSRATFYRNFDIIEDVLTWYGENLTRNIFNEYFTNPKIHQTIAFNRFAMTCGLRQAEYFEILTLANKLHIMQNMLYGLLEKIPLNVDSDTYNNPYLKYALGSKIGAFFGVINCWIESGKKEPLSKLLDNLDNIDRMAKDLTVDTTYITNSRFFK